MTWTRKGLGAMIRKTAATAACLCIMFLGQPASAGIFTDDLSRCLVRSSTETDRSELVTWLFFAESLNPQVKNFTTVSEKQRDESNKVIASLFERLLLQDCRTETVAALKNEGGGVIEASFSVLGTAAGRELVSDPKVGAEIGKIGTYLDKEKWTALRKEAGTAAPENSAK
jgi:hypothetical protein